MTHPQQEMVVKKRSLLDWVPVMRPPVRGITWLLNAIKNRIPEGYQDETGFHFGTKPSGVDSTGSTIE